MWPSIISSLSDPNPTDRLNAPSHSSIESAQNANIEQIQTFIGTTTSSAVGTILYDARSPDSNGGGHVQTANKGGTGQTAYTKGDLLVATSSSVLAKFAVSSTAGEVLTIDPSQAAGMKWANSSNTKVAVVSSQLGVSGVTTETVIFAASVIGSTLGTNNAVRFTGTISQLSIAGARGITFTGKYGNNTIFSLGATASGTGVSNLIGTIEGTIIGNGSDVSQKTVARTILTGGNIEAEGETLVNISKLMSSSYNTSSVISSANQNLIITAQHTGANTYGSVVGQFFVVEKIL